MDPALAYTLIAGIFSGGAAWGGSRVALNGTRERVKNMDAKLDTHIAEDGKVQTALLTGMTRIETKLDERTGGNHGGG